MSVLGRPFCINVSNNTLEGWHGISLLITQFVSKRASEGDFQHWNTYSKVNVQLQLAPKQSWSTSTSINSTSSCQQWCKSYFQIKGHMRLKDPQISVGYLNKWMTNYLTKCYSNYSSQNTKLFYCYVFKLCKILGLTCRECFKFAPKAYKEPKDELTSWLSNWLERKLSVTYWANFFFMYSSTPGVLSHGMW